MLSSFSEAAGALLDDFLPDMLTYLSVMTCVSCDVALHVPVALRLLNISLVGSNPQ